MPPAATIGPIFHDRLWMPQYSDCARASSDVTYTPSLAMSCVAPMNDSAKKIAIRKVMYPGSSISSATPAKPAPMASCEHRTKNFLVRYISTNGANSGLTV
jgi:hypothetical protein